MEYMEHGLITAQKHTDTLARQGLSSKTREHLTRLAERSIEEQTTLERQDLKEVS